MAARFSVDLENLEWTSVDARLSKKVIHGDRMTMTLYRFAPGGIFSEHSHDQEQMTIVQEGSIVFGVEGKDYRLDRGDLIVIPSGVVHRAEAGPDGADVLSVVSPGRSHSDGVRFVSTESSTDGTPSDLSPSERSVAVGLVQLGTRPLEPDENRKKLAVAVATAVEGGAQVVVLPELAVSGYATDADALRTVAEPLDGPTISGWVELAARHSAFICGGFCELDGDQLFNSAVLVGPSGIHTHYRKLHPFREEKTVFSPGDKGLPVVETPIGKIGVCVCYDLRFVEVARILALAGAELICVPTAWVPGFDQVKWEADGMCPQARGALVQANLNQVHIACASQVGRPGAIQFLGSSILADPSGNLIVGPLSGNDEEIAVGTIDLDQVTHAQRRHPLISPREERRRDVYAVCMDESRM